MHSWKNAHISSQRGKFHQHACHRRGLKTGVSFLPCPETREREDDLWSQGSKRTGQLNKLRIENKGNLRELAQTPWKKREQKQRSAASAVRDKELNCLITNFYIKRGNICTRVCYISTDSLNFSRAVGSLCGYWKFVRFIKPLVEMCEHTSKFATGGAFLSQRDLRVLLCMFL